MTNRNDIINDLVKRIKEAQDAYYNGEDAIMSDAEFDEIWDNLTYLDPSNPILHKIGEDSGSVFKKAEHVLHMFSQQKCKEPHEFLTWAKKYPQQYYLVQHKLDGSSLELQYINGKLIRCVTRGNGFIGDDVTQNISDVPLNIDPSFTGGVRGEVLLFHDDFVKHFKDKANCRNAANGIMKRKDGKDHEYLKVICYDVKYTDNDKLFNTETEKIKFMRSNGFRVVPTQRLTDVKDIIRLRDKLGKARFEDLDYDIDGLVIKCDKVDPEDVLRDRPDQQIAFKFSLDEKITTLKGVEWSVSGKTRTPVGICEPVRLNGTTVQRANLCNIDLINKLNIKIGSEVVMVKRGEIIPKIERVVNTPANAKDITIPTICEHCGSKLIITPTEIYCPNSDCPSTVIHRIGKWCEIHKIYDLGEAGIRSLYESGTVKDIVDFYNNDKIESDLKKILGEAIGSKVYPRIENSRTTTLSKVLQGFDMDWVGGATAKLLTSKLSDDFDTLKSMLTYNNVATLPGMAEISSRNIVNSIRKNVDKISELVKYLNLEKSVKSNGKLNDLNICITGELNSMGRNQAKELIENNGGKLQSSVSRNTNYLVTNSKDGNSSKFRTAVKLGIPIINEAQLIQMLK